MKKKRISDKLYFRFFCVYGITSTVLVLLIGVVFFRLYTNNVLDSFKEQLQSDAKEIAYSVDEYVLQDEYNGFLDYVEAVQAILESQKVDVWIMPYYKSDNRLKDKYANTKIRYKKLSPGMKKVMKKVYSEGSVTGNSGYDDIYDEEMIRAGAPIYDAGGNVIGGVLLNGMVSGRMEVINRGKEIIVYSLIFSWIISVIISLLLSTGLTGPISQIRKTAISLADGDYEAKTGIHKRGEIGELAETVDILSYRLSENEKVREEIEQGRRDFFANVSHELRTPITVMRGYTETLADGIVTEPDRVRHTLDRMLKECSGMERLVGDLLILSKMQNPDFELEKEPVSIVQILAEVVRSAKVLSEKKNIKINFEYNDEYCFMLGDYGRLRQLFLIILDNAVKFSNDNSSVDITVQKSDKLTVSIRDYGIGIEQDMIDNIFEKFYRSKLKMNEKGSGLGLVIAKQITLKHDGSIDVKSKPGEGSTFIITFDGIDAPEE